MARGTIHNPLEAYRRTQRELREQFEAFTKKHCPTLPDTPCCRQPARDRDDRYSAEPKRVELADYDPTHRPGDRRACRRKRRRTEAEEGRRSEKEEPPPALSPCSVSGGPWMPPFRRIYGPFGCTAFICRPMYEHLDRTTLTRIKRLVKELEERHVLLLRTLPPE